MPDRAEATAFGRLLRERRTRRNLTQERLAARAGVSTRHLSFLETGRSNPSRDSVLALSETMDVPLRDRNRLLRAAGFSAVYPERNPLSTEDHHVRSLFEFLLERHEPYPAYVVDHTWTVRMHNRPGTRLLRWILGEEPGELVGRNHLRMLFDPDGIRPYVVNFDEVARFLWDRLEEEIVLHPEDQELEELRRDLKAFGSVPEGTPEVPRRSGPPALPIHLRRDGTDLRLLSFLVTVAAPRDAGLQDVRIETFLPADAGSDDLLRAGEEP